MTYKEKREQKCQLVRNFLETIRDNTARLVCFLIMHGYEDYEICKQLHIKQNKLDNIKLQLAFDMKNAGIVVGREA